MSDQTWDEVIATTRVVKTRDEALAHCSRRGPTGSFLWRSLKNFWLWHLPILGRVWSFTIFLRIASAFVQHRQDPLPVLFRLVFDVVVLDTAWVLGFSDGTRPYWICLVALFGRILLVTILLVVFRIIQRLSWRTTELKTFPNVKDDPRYQDEELLNKAWALAEKQGWTDPTKCNDFQNGVGGGTVVMQPIPGFCGLATLNSTLRSFGGKADGRGSDAPYLTLHSHGRYVTMEEMVKLIKTSICNEDGGESAWVKNGGRPVDSFQVVRGGKHGIVTLEQFRACLQQMYHPTQPAHIMTIYHRSPLFFCSGPSVKSKLKCFPMVHWSPVPAYLEEEDLVLIMDVNHTYGPRGYLVPVDRFFDSVNTRDIFNGAYHGLIMFRPPPPKDHFPVLVRPREISVEFGRIKRQYYEHQASGKIVSVSDIKTSNDGGYKPFDDNENGKKLIRLVTPDDSAKAPGISAIISGHPTFFTNEIFIDEGYIPKRETVRSFISVFSQLRSPARVALRAFDASTEQEIHRILIASGMVQIMKGTRKMVLNLSPPPPFMLKSSTERLPHGYYIDEIVWDPKKDKSDHSLAVESLARLIPTSYKFPAVNRRGCSPADFFAQAYQTFSHGGDSLLRHFVCYERESGDMAACAALFCGGKDERTRSDCAAIFNVCTSPNHRRKRLGYIMTLRAIEEAKKRGVTQIILEASKEGKHLYDAMGFVTVVDEHGGLYASLSIATDDIKWKNLFRMVELFLRIKNRR